jgi:hypothetical protein
MSEPKWWPMGEIPTEDGNYLCRFDGRVSCWVFPKDRPLKFELGQFYGPIPEPPREVPIGRRFRATHKNIGPVSGLYVKEREPIQMGYNVLYWEIDILRALWTELEYLSDIQWLDKE